MITGGDMVLDIIDAVFAIGTGLFMVSALPAAIKLHRVKYSDAQSLVHNELHLVALGFMFAGYLALSAPMSLTITSFELVFRVYIIKIIRKKRSHKLKYPSDILYYICKGGKRLHEVISSSSSE